MLRAAGLGPGALLFCFFALGLGANSGTPVESV